LIEHGRARLAMRTESRHGACHRYLQRKSTLGMTDAWASSTDDVPGSQGARPDVRAGRAAGP
jgi:hypothetical protein